MAGNKPIPVLGWGKCVRGSVDRKFDLRERTVKEGFGFIQNQINNKLKDRIRKAFPSASVSFEIVAEQKDMGPFAKTYWYTFNLVINGTPVSGHISMLPDALKKVENEIINSKMGEIEGPLLVRDSLLTEYGLGEVISFVKENKLHQLQENAPFWSKLITPSPESEKCISSTDIFRYGDISNKDHRVLFEFFEKTDSDERTVMNLFPTYKKNLGDIMREVFKEASFKDKCSMSVVLFELFANYAYLLTDISDDVDKDPYEQMMDHELSERCPTAASFKTLTEAIGKIFIQEKVDENTVFDLFKGCLGIIPGKVGPFCAKLVDVFQKIYRLHKNVNSLCQLPQGFTGLLQLMAIKNTALRFEEEYIQPLNSSIQKVRDSAPRTVNDTYNIFPDTRKEGERGLSEITQKYIDSAPVSYDVRSLFEKEKEMVVRRR